MAPPRYGIDVIRVTRQDVIESCLVEDANDNGKPAAPSSALRAVVKTRHGRRNSGSRQHGLLYQRHPDKPGVLPSHRRRPVRRRYRERSKDPSPACSLPHNPR